MLKSIYLYRHRHISFNYYIIILYNLLYTYLFYHKIPLLSTPKIVNNL
nr:MAG TPA: hypothetical protein [Caudoviricetes sp.]